MNLLGAHLEPESTARNSIFRDIYRDVVREPKGNGRTALPVVWATTRGTVRSENQDRFAVLARAGGLAVAVLADGMGGMKEGARAAAIAVSAVISHCMTSASSDPHRLLVDALRFANVEVFRELRGDGGAAVVVAAWTPHARYIAHAGDARGYWIQADSRLKPLTVDDTVQAQLQEMGRAPRVDPRHDSRLLQFIGVGKDLEPHIAKAPDNGRGLILTTDGVHSLPHAVMEWIVMRAGLLQDVAKRFVDASEWHGGEDNASVIAISFQNGCSWTAGTSEVWAPDRIVFPTENRAADKIIRSAGAGNATEEIRAKKAGKPRGRRTSQGKAGPGAASRIPVVEFGEPRSAVTTTLDSPQPPLFPAGEGQSNPVQSAIDEESNAAKIAVDTDEHQPETPAPSDHGE